MNFFYLIFHISQTEVQKLEIPKANPFFFVLETQREVGYRLLW